MTNQSIAELQPESELRFWMAVTRRMPQVRGSGRLCSIMNRIYNRKKRREVAASVFGAKMILEPSDCVEGQLLFCPQLYDWREISLLRKYLKPGDTFADGGANVGFYSLIASEVVGPTGMVVAIEADPYNASRLATNLRVNDRKNVRLVNAGLSDKIETLKLGISQGGNRGGNSFLYDGPEKVEVACKPFTDILLAEGISKVDGAKFDIEGFEFRVLDRFFRDGKKNLWPKFFIIEYLECYLEKTGGNVLDVLTRHGYEVTRIHEHNYFAVRKDSAR